ncbi:killer cell lectin-like receptor subfamily C, member 2 isoform X1 [Mus musculus]|uniref:killer cell lectin-like receptor subfamily C, member 2 isoform X1 n=1 Tax=Mus musculus TaxID=10090 RepID=UPI00015DEFB0|nr:killer cell lectin-like receptor subfamily C, member 2 isoform X1 [Mus musculus]|eukprot:XP_017176908.1 PREDICTED: killer cell lectin-like receptor subfamily C, member 2 isoform X1 [Mus musculus]
MSHLLGTEQASEPRKATKKTQAQFRFSNAAGDRLLEFSLQHASQKHLKASRHGYCKNFASPPEKLIAGILGTIWFTLLIALVISTRIVSPYAELKKQIHPFLVRTQKGSHALLSKDINYTLSSAQPCPHCPKEWISYSHNCYFIGMERKSWNDSLGSCLSKNCSLLHIDSEEEQDFLQSLSLVSWTGILRKGRGQAWDWKKDSIFKPKIAEISHDECNCAMMSASGLTADNCTTLHPYLCKCKFPI